MLRLSKASDSWVVIFLPILFKFLLSRDCALLWLLLEKLNSSNDIASLEILVFDFLVESLCYWDKISLMLSTLESCKFLPEFSVYFFTLLEFSVFFLLWSSFKNKFFLRSYTLLEVSVFYCSGRYIV